MSVFVIVLNKKKRSILKKNHIPESVFFERISNGWSMKAALNTKINNKSLERPQINNLIHINKPKQTNLDRRLFYVKENI